MKVLIALDNSDCSQLALSSVISRPWPDESDIKVVHVLEPYDPINSTANEAQWSDWVETVNSQRKFSAQEMLANAVKRIKASHANIEVTSELLERYLPDQSIVEAAEQWSADLIVLGSHSRRGLKRLLLGSIAHSVLQQAPCTVEIIKSQWSLVSEQLNVLVALDQSERASQVLKTILQRPWPEHTSFKILCVVQPAIDKCVGSDNPISALSILEEDKEYIEQLQTDLAQKAKTLDSHLNSNTASFEVVAGDPREVILRRIEDWPAHLVLVGSQGKTGLQRLFIGSVSHAVALHSWCSVEVVKTL